VNKQNLELRKALIAGALRIKACGLGRGTSGNLSVRAAENGENGFLVTPSGMPYDTLTPDDIVFMRLDGTSAGQRKPSSEWRIHRDLYAHRNEAQAILHAHSPFATSLSCLHRDIPAFHYMTARFGGNSVRCASYATFGTQELSAAALRAMLDRSACLLSNHGMLVFGSDVSHALCLGVELEELCEHYWRASLIGHPVILTDSEMKVIVEKFAAYGQQSQNEKRI